MDLQTATRDPHTFTTQPAPNATGNIARLTSYAPGSLLSPCSPYDPAQVTPTVLDRFLAHDDGFEFLDPMDSSNVRSVVSRYSREDVAAGHQEALVALQHLLR